MINSLDCMTGVAHVYMLY